MLTVYWIFWVLVLELARSESSVHYAGLPNEADSTTSISNNEPVLKGIVSTEPDNFFSKINKESIARTESYEVECNNDENCAKVTTTLSSPIVSEIASHEITTKKSSDVPKKNSNLNSSTLSSLSSQFEVLHNTGASRRGMYDSMELIGNELDSKVNSVSASSTYISTNPSIRTDESTSLSSKIMTKIFSFNATSTWESTTINGEEYNHVTTSMPDYAAEGIASEPLIKIPVSTPSVLALSEYMPQASSSTPAIQMDNITITDASASTAEVSNYYDPSNETFGQNNTFLSSEKTSQDDAQQYISTLTSLVTELKIGSEIFSTAHQETLPMNNPSDSYRNQMPSTFQASNTPVTVLSDNIKSSNDSILFIQSTTPITEIESTPLIDDKVLEGATEYDFTNISSSSFQMINISQFEKVTLTPGDPFTKLSDSPTSIVNDSSRKYNTTPLVDIPNLFSTISVQSTTHPFIEKNSETSKQTHYIFENNTDDTSESLIYSALPSVNTIYKEIVNTSLLPLTPHSMPEKNSNIDTHFENITN